MDGGNNDLKRVLFVENKKKLSEMDKKDVQYVIIKKDGEIDEGASSIKDKSRIFLRVGIGISVTIIISYIASYSQDELFPGGETLFSLFYQLAIAYLMSALFYYITIVIPQRARREKTRMMINNRLAQIAWDMSNVAREIKNAELEDNRINFLAKSRVIDCNSANVTEHHYLSVAEYVILTTKEIVENCKWLLAIFYYDLPAETVVTINDVMNTYINRKEFRETVRDFGVFEVVGDDILEEYEKMIEEIKKCRIK